MPSRLFEDYCASFLKHIRAAQRAAYLYCVDGDIEQKSLGDDACLGMALSTIDIEKAMTLTDFLLLLEIAAPDEIYFMASQFPVDFENIQFAMADIGAGMESDAPLGQFEATALFNAMMERERLNLQALPRRWSTHIPDCPSSLWKELEESAAARGLTTATCGLHGEEDLSKRTLEDGIDRGHSHQKTHGVCLSVSGDTAPLALWILDFVRMDVVDPEVVLRELRQETF